MKFVVIVDAVVVLLLLFLLLGKCEALQVAGIRA